MNGQQFQACLLAALCSFSFVGAQAFDPPNSIASRVCSFNKASNLVGMKIQNHQGEELGQIDDLVIDFNTGRVAYAVLAMEENLGESTKYVAIPIAAFTPSSDNTKVILRADKERLERAPGFAKSDLPDMKSPLWGAATEWSPETDIPSIGEPDSTAVVIGEPEPTPVVMEPAPITTYEYRTDRSYSYPSGRQTFKGHVASVNPEARTLAVESDGGELREFTVSRKPVIALKNNRNAMLLDVKAGMPVRIGYRMGADGTYVAETIIRRDTPDVK